MYEVASTGINADMRYCPTVRKEYQITGLQLTPVDVLATLVLGSTGVR
jgi:hypothetical protein